VVCGVPCPVRAPTTLLRPMPIYEYRCTNGHTFEVIQSMSDDPVETCEECGAPVERVFHPVAVHFKGSGFYSTDYGAKAKAGASKDGDSGGDSASSSGSDSSSSESSGAKSGSNGSDKKTTTPSSD
jgi:putative FmdB family regulatory protein